MALDIPLMGLHNISMGNTKFTYIDLFSGIGGFKIGLDKAGGKSKGYSEIDKFAIETYKQNFRDKGDIDYGDVTKIQSLPYVDMIVGGVPCQSWSIAGKKRGFDDPRGRLWNDAIRMVKLAKPKVFIFENVKGLMDPRNHANLELILENLDSAGYTCHYKLLNSYDYGVPQNRTRIFIVGFKKSLKKFSEEFSYPEPIESHISVEKVLEDFEIKDISKQKFDPHLIHGDFIPKSRNAFQKEDELNDFFIFCDTRNGHTSIHSWDITKTSKAEKHICMTILTNRRKKKYGDYDGNPMTFEDLKELIPSISKKDLDSLINKKILKYNEDMNYDLANSKNSAGVNGIYRIFLPNSKIFSTLTATGTKDFIATDYVLCNNPTDYKQAFIDQIYKTKKYRQVSAREAGRIQGFPEDFKPHLKDRYAQKQFGNAVSPPVISALAERVVLTGVFEGELVKSKKKTTHYIFSRDFARVPQQLPLLGYMKDSTAS
jgi:DNA (cytosine-5)-methyltransferase 1